MTDLQSAVTVERLAAENGWKFFLTATCLIADLEEWEETVTVAGPLLSARVSGPQVVEAVRRIAAGGDMAGVGAFHRAQLDYTVPGRVACVWQSNGVWVELWHPDPVAAPPAPVQAVPAPSSALPAVIPSQQKPRGRFSPSGRLHFTRRNKETTS